MYECSFTFKIVESPCYRGYVAVM